MDDPQLDIGVGHVPASSWPGFTGTDVLSAHDVTWFSHIDRLSVGNSISMVTPCHTFDYTVVSHSVVNAGSPIFQSTHGRLVLVTCYPLNALVITPQRYLVEATLTAVTNEGTVMDPTSPAAPLPTVAAPPPLAAEGLTLAQNPTPLGLLSLAGSPTTAYSQSSAPLQAEALVLELYFAAVHAAAQDQPGWWAAIAPGVPFTNVRPFFGVHPTTTVAVHPTLQIAGNTLTGATLTSSVRVSGRTYALTMTATVGGTTLSITGFTLQPAS